tara:strand:+ start:396 stop:584 length:189 start_codon:yes stop_codon:yes gene_type:complete
VPHCEKPTAQTAHLVFADTQANRLKNQKSCFFPTLEKGMLKISEQKIYGILTKSLTLPKLSR